jgi:hypothetical protein
MNYLAIQQTKRRLSMQKDHTLHGQHRLARHCLLVCMALAAATSAAKSATLPPIQMHSGWVTFKNIEIKDEFKIFRRYGVIDDSPKNLIMFNCSRDVSKAASHLTFVLPKDFHPESFPRSAWLPKIDVRVLIDDKLSVLMPAEYRDGEFYFDLNTDTQKNFDKSMLADTLALGFGDKNDIIQYEFTDKFDAMFAAFIKDIGGKFGEMTHYTRTGADSVEDSCAAYQQSGRQTAMGPEKVLIVLFSTVAALEIDCAFKSNRRELERLARLHGFKLEDFQSGGRFLDKIEDQTHAMRRFIQEKGCRVARGAVTKNFQNVGK